MMPPEPQMATRTFLLILFLWLSLAGLSGGINRALGSQQDLGITRSLALSDLLDLTTLHEDGPCNDALLRKHPEAMVRHPSEQHLDHINSILDQNLPSDSLRRLLRANGIEIDFWEPHEALLNISTLPTPHASRVQILSVTNRIAAEAFRRALLRGDLSGFFRKIEHALGLEVQSLVGLELLFFSSDDWYPTTKGALIYSPSGNFHQGGYLAELLVEGPPHSSLIGNPKGTLEPFSLGQMREQLTAWHSPLISKKISSLIDRFFFMPRISQQELHLLAALLGLQIDLTAEDGSGLTLVSDEKAKALRASLVNRIFSLQPPSNSLSDSAIKDVIESTLAMGLGALEAFAQAPGSGGRRWIYGSTNQGSTPVIIFEQQPLSNGQGHFLTGSRAFVVHENITTGELQGLGNCYDGGLYILEGSRSNQASYESLLTRLEAKNLALRNRTSGGTDFLTQQLPGSRVFLPGSILRAATLFVSTYLQRHWSWTERKWIEYKRPG